MNNIRLVQLKGDRFGVYVSSTGEEILRWGGSQNLKSKIVDLPFERDNPDKVQANLQSYAGKDFNAYLLDDDGISAILYNVPFDIYTKTIEYEKGLRSS